LVVAFVLALPDTPFAQTPLPDEMLQRFLRIESDPLPKKLAADAHFVVSDEGAHYLFKDAITGLGGCMVGVGTDQNYIMAGWARPELLIIADFDELVVDVHKLYRLAFIHSETPSDFVRAWKDNTILKLLETERLSPSEQKRLEKVYLTSKNLIVDRLLEVRKTYKKAKTKTFLDDQEQFDFIRKLFLTNRVFAFRGDLTGNKTYRQIGEALRHFGIPVRVLYLSNAEKYFDCLENYKKNMRGLPFDEKSVVLRTAGGWDIEVAPDGLYTYLVQPASSFLAFMQDGIECSFKTIVNKRRLDKKKKGLGVIDFVPAPKTKGKR
jgi:hypothetical protein